MRLVGALISTAVLAAAVASTAPAQVVACGAEVTADLTLEAPLTGCSTGLIVAADDVTIDLNGHAIEGIGTSEGSGIEGVDRSGLTIRNGHIRGFRTGVRFFRTSESTLEDLAVSDTFFGIVLGGEPVIGPGSDHNEVLRTSIVNAQQGLVLGSASSWNRILQNSVTGVSGAGISCSLGTGNVFDGNYTVGNGVGISLNFCSVSDVINNVANQNVFTGIARARTAGRVEGNVANGNGQWGIYSDDSHGAFIGNVTNQNGFDGLRIDDSVSSHGPFHSVAQHVANTNGGHGIVTDLEGVVDGGKNRAHANGASVQCLGVVCNQKGGP